MIQFAFLLGPLGNKSESLWVKKMGLQSWSFKNIFFQLITWPTFRGEEESDKVQQNPQVLIFLTAILNTFFTSFTYLNHFTSMLFSMHYQI